MYHEQDKFLPIANVGRIMKQILPPNAKISKEAKQRMQEYASEFICFVTGEANEKCIKENRKTINGDDISSALSSLGFDNYSDAVIVYLQRLRKFERERVTNSMNSINEMKGEATSTWSYTEEPVDETSILPASLFKFSILDKLA